MSRFVMVGGGPASFFALRALRSLDNESKVTVISDDPDMFYFRPAIPSFVVQKIESSQIFMAPATGCQSPQFGPGSRYGPIHRSRREIRDDHGRADLRI